MKKIDTYIIEKLKLNKDSKIPDLLEELQTGDKVLMVFLRRHHPDNYVVFNVDTVYKIEGENIYLSYYEMFTFKPISDKEYIPYCDGYEVDNKYKMGIMTAENGIDLIEQELNNKGKFIFDNFKLRIPRGELRKEYLERIKKSLLEK